MGDNTKIEWTDATWNPITGCSLVSPGCTNCYAMKVAGTRLRNHPSRVELTQETKGGPVWNGQVRLNEEWLSQPPKWRKPRRIFVCAHGDLFHENVPDEWIDKVFAVMALANHHTFQVLTKRPARMKSYLTLGSHLRIAEAIDMILPSALWNGNKVEALQCIRDGKSFPNIWMGVSVEDQARADERIPLLLDTPAAIRFISAEPLLGHLNIYHWLWPDQVLGGRFGCVFSEGEPPRYNFGPPKLNWVIAGGESGPGARPMHPDWARSLRDQCMAARVAFHFKQFGSWQVSYDRDRDDPDWKRCPKAANENERYLNLAGGYGFHGDRVVFVRNVGKKVAGRTLDGRTWDQFPESGAA